MSWRTGPLATTYTGLTVLRDLKTVQLTLSGLNSTEWVTPAEHLIPHQAIGISMYSAYRFRFLRPDHDTISRRVAIIVLCALILLFGMYLPPPHDSQSQPAPGKTVKRIEHTT